MRISHVWETTGKGQWWVICQVRQTASFCKSSWFLAMFIDETYQTVFVCFMSKRMGTFGFHNIYIDLHKNLPCWLQMVGYPFLIMQHNPKHQIWSFRSSLLSFLYHPQHGTQSLFEALRRTRGVNTAPSFQTRTHAAGEGRSVRTDSQSLAIFNISSMWASFGWMCLHTSTDEKQSARPSSRSP